MNKSDFENKSLIVIIVVAYTLNAVFTLTGHTCFNNSNTGMLFFQIANAFAISASVMAGRYTGLRGQHVAASAYILMGIAHGISLASLSRASINVDRGMTMVIPMIPALIFIFWCNLYPLWLRILGLLPIVFFTLVFINVQLGHSYFGWPLTLGYGTLQGIEILWGIYLLKDWKQNMVKRDHL
jgi:hypothetical protein